MSGYRIYVVDDEKSVRHGVVFGLKKHYQVEAFSNAEAALAAVKNERPDLVLLDIGLPGMNGIEALREIKKRYSQILVIMITAYEDIKTVISAMKHGAHDYVTKPVHMDSLKISIENALETIRLRKEIQNFQEQCIRENLPCFIGESHAIQDMMQFVERVAQSPDTPILIAGESGTGKELIASAIHYKSPNFKGPFVTLNCAAIPKDLIESELFGYAKGAFSGASASGKKGLIEQAADGTLFLDEVGDLSTEAQAKLLRFLEQGEYYKVGSTKKLHARARIVSATNKDLNGMIKKELFRRDLYHRLAVIEVKIPSLKERLDDIVPIAQHFLIEFSRKFDKTFTGITPQAEKALRKFHWKGNVRELKNVIERAVLIAGGPELTLQDFGLEHKGNDEVVKETENFPALASIPPPGVDFPSILESIEKDYIREALKIVNNNESKAAALLNLSRDTFRYRRKKLKIT